MLEEPESPEVATEMRPVLPPHTVPLPTWNVVLWLALPVLAQQGLTQVVHLSDRFLAGHLPASSLQQKAETLGYRLLATINLAGLTPGGSCLDRALAAETAWELARKSSASQVAFQAAQTTAGYLAWFISGYTILVTVGSIALVARFTGAGDHALARHAANQSILLAIILGSLFSAVGLLGGIRLLIHVLQLRGEAAAWAISYLQPLLLLLPFQIVEAAGIACLVGAGDTRTGLWVTMGVAIVNLPLAWSFSLGLGPFPQLGFVGIAVGTALSNTFGGLIVLTILIRGRRGLRLSLPLLWPHADLLRRLLRISVPAGLDSMSVAVGQFWFLSLVNKLGDVASSAHGIALTWEALGYLSGAAFGMAGMTVVGQNLGAGRPEQATRGGWRAFALGCAVMTFMGAVFFSLAQPMFQLFCPYPAQRPIIDAGVPVLQLVAFAMPALACTVIFTGILRGAGDTRVPVIFSWIGFFLVRIPVTYLLAWPELDLGELGRIPCLNLGLLGAWLAMFADLLVRGAFFLYRFGWGPWHKTQV